VVLSYPAAIPLSTRSLNHLAALIRSRRQHRRSRWRRLDPGRQALLALAHLRNGDTLTCLAAGFEIGVTTAWAWGVGRRWRVVPDQGGVPATVSGDWLCASATAAASLPGRRCSWRS